MKLFSHISLLLIMRCKVTAYIQGSSLLYFLHMIDPVWHTIIILPERRLYYSWTDRQQKEASKSLFYTLQAAEKSDILLK